MTLQKPCNDKCYQSGPLDFHNLLAEEKCSVHADCVYHSGVHFRLYGDTPSVILGQAKIA